MSKSQEEFWKQKCKEWIQRMVMKSTAVGEFKKELRNDRWEKKCRGRTLRMHFHGSCQLVGERVNRTEYWDDNGVQTHTLQTLEKGKTERGFGGTQKILFASPSYTKEKTQFRSWKSTQSPLTGIWFDFTRLLFMQPQPDCMPMPGTVQEIRWTQILFPFAQTLKYD